MSLTIFAYIVLFSRVAIGFSFLISSISKISNFQQFRRAITAFHILPHQFINITALFLVCTEAVVVVCVILGDIFLTLGFFLAIILLFLFSISLLSILARKMVVSCNCFGPNDKPVTGFDIVRNGGLIVCALTGSCVLFIGEQPNYPLSLPEWIMGGMSAIVFVLIWIQLGDIMPLLFQEG